MNARDIEFSLLRGGLLLRWLETWHLISPQRVTPLRPAVVVAAATWLPLMTIALIQRAIVGHFDPLLRDFSMHVRMLIAIPCLFASDMVLGAHCKLAFARFIQGRFVAARDVDALRRIIMRAVRMRDSVAAEVVLIAVVFGLAIAALLGWTEPMGLVHGVVTHKGSAVHVWYVLLVLPVYQFLFARWIWRWTIWNLCVCAIARLPLRLMPTHPDRAGGIGLFARPVEAFSLFAMGTSAVVAAAWYSQVRLIGVSARDFVPMSIVLVVLFEVVALGPLVMFSTQMRRARLRGVAQYGRVALRLTRAFEQRWVARGDPATLLDRQDVSALADMLNSYDGIRLMRVTPFDRLAAIQLAAATLLPMLPLVTTEIPLIQLITQIAQALTIGKVS